MQTVTIVCAIAMTVASWPATGLGQEWIPPVFPSDQVQFENEIRPPAQRKRRLVAVTKTKLSSRVEKQPSLVNSPTATEPGRHKLAIQVADNNPQVMTLALNNARNVYEEYKAKGEKVAIEVVAFGPGLHMLRDDTSPVKQRVAAMTREAPEIKFVACAHTQANMSRQEQKPIVLIGEANLAPSGVVHLIELQSRGYAYVRP